MKIRRFTTQDVKEVSSLIRKTLIESNSKFYPQKVINFLCNEYSPKNLIGMLRKKEFFIAINKGKIIGVAGLEKNNIISVFILPECQNKGIGKKLMNRVELKAKEKGFMEVNLNASINALEFYKNIGYEEGKKVDEENYGITYEMKKRL